MPKSKDITLASRNLQIQQMRDEGRTMQAIADTVGLSKARISQILEEMDEETTAGGYRAFLAANGELGLAEVMKILRKPSPQKISAAGVPVYELDPDDPSARTKDLSKPIYDDSIKLEAVGKLPPLLDRLSKLRGADAVKAAPKDESSEFETAWAWAQQQRTLALDLASRLAKYEMVEISEDDEYVEAEIIPES